MDSEIPEPSSASLPKPDRSCGKTEDDRRKDGRANNKPPAANMIKKGEVRNPHGRAGKPKPETSNRFDELHLAEAVRIVSRDADGLVDAFKRLVQQEWHDALVAGDEKARIRVMDAAAAAFTRKAARENEQRKSLWESKAHYSEIFHSARKLRKSPPDVMHPDHVVIERDGISYVGPIGAENRKRWELLKASIKIAQFLHAHARKKGGAQSMH
jgi:hypothetical protein